MKYNNFGTFFFLFIVPKKFFFVFFISSKILLRVQPKVTPLAPKETAGIETNKKQQKPKNTAFLATVFAFTALPLVVYFLYLSDCGAGGTGKVPSIYEQQMNARSASSLFSVVYVTVPSLEVGKKIAQEVVGKRLAACVNIVPQLVSIYEWKGRLEEDQESMLIIKTGTDRLDALREAVLKSHPYDVPEFIALPIEHGSEPYLKWIREQTSSEKSHNNRIEGDNNADTGNKPSGEGGGGREGGD